MDFRNCFRSCPLCGQQWQSRREFISDNNLILNGYKVDFERLEYGLFFFTHEMDGCHTTIAIESGNFLDLYSGEIYGGRITGSEQCLRRCLDFADLEPCDRICECAFVREVIQIIRQSQQSAA